MQKLLLMSVLIATFVVPAVLVRRNETSYSRMLGWFAGFLAVYVFLLLYVYPRLS